MHNLQNVIFVGKISRTVLLHTSSSYNFLRTKFIIQFLSAILNILLQYGFYKKELSRELQDIIEHKKRIPEKEKIRQHLHRVAGENRDEKKITEYVDSKWSCARRRGSARSRDLASRTTTHLSSICGFAGTTSPIHLP